MAHPYTFTPLPRLDQQDDSEIETTWFSTPEEVGQMLRISRQSVYNLVKDGHLPAFRVSRQAMRIPTQAVWDFLRGRQVDPNKILKVDALDPA